jgi:hypothetical protein
MLVHSLVCIFSRHVSAPIGGHLQVVSGCINQLKFTTRLLLSLVLWTSARRQGAAENPVLFRDSVSELYGHSELHGKKVVLHS